MFDPIDDVLVSRYFLDVPESPGYFQTDNEAVAWQEFNRCQFPCLLIDTETKMTLAEKEFVDNVESDGCITLAESNYTGYDYAELEEVEA